MTSGGAAADADCALRAAGLVCRTAICVVDREEGGADALRESGPAAAFHFFSAQQLSTASVMPRTHIVQSDRPLLLGSRDQ